MKMQFKKYCLLIIITVLFINSSIAQIDTLFWFAVPYGTDLHSNREANIVLSAMDPVNVTNIMITQPYNPIMDTIYVTIDPLIPPATADLHFTEAELLEIMNNTYIEIPIDPNPRISNCAIKIQADRDITAYYEYQRLGNNNDIFSLKGRNAMGYDFWIPFQDEWYNHTYDGDPAFAQIIIAATEPNTEVEITFPKRSYDILPGTYTFNLAEPGMTMMFVPIKDAADGDEPSRFAVNRLDGTHITSNKPIVVTINDDSVEKNGWDFIGDQLVPTINIDGAKTIGLEYLVIKGKVTDNAQGNEKVFVLTTEDNTAVSYKRKGDPALINFPLTPVAGTQLDIDLIEDVDPLLSNEFVYIVADKPIYVFHVSGFGGELGGALIPTIDGCTGSLDVTVVRAKTGDFYLPIMTHFDALNFFEISSNGGPFVPFLSNADFEYSGIGDLWVIKETSYKQNGVVQGVPTRIRNTVNVFHLGVINQRGGTCEYGYFSDFKEARGSAVIVESGTDIVTSCYGEVTELKASGGLSYSWTPAVFLDDPTSSSPTAFLPVGIHDFEVTIDRPCFPDTTINTRVQIYENTEAYFTLDDNIGCAPFTVEINNLTLNADTFLIDFEDDRNFDYFADTNSATTFSHTYYNPTSTDSLYTLKLYAYDKKKDCPDIYTKNIRVFPEINASFSMDTMQGCNPLLVNFTDLSTSLTSDDFKWEFGDGQSIIDTLPPVNVSHEFGHFNTTDTVRFNVELVATSPYFCRDTARSIVSVYSYLESEFTIDTAYGCSPFEVVFSNISAGQDSISLILGDGNELNGADFVTETHIYENTGDTVAYFPVELQTFNDEGCVKVWRDTIIVYPEFEATFTIDGNSFTGCNTREVEFVNTTPQGVDIANNFLWTFGDGSSINTTNVNVSHIYTNTSNSDTTFTFNLHAESQHGCFDDTSNIIIMNKALAEFTLEDLDGCSPLTLTINNSSDGDNITNWNWDYGDGGTSTDENPAPYVYNNTGFEVDTNILKLEVIGSLGCSSIDSALIIVYPEINIDAITPLNQTICDSVVLNFTSSILNASLPNVDYYWSFGDGASSILPNPSHLYRNITAIQKNLDVSLDVETENGCTDTISTTVVVDPYVKASFTIDVSEDCSPLNLTISNNSKGGIYRWYWNSETALVPEDYLSGPTEVIPHTYVNNSGGDQTFYLTLIAENLNGCQDTLTREVIVHSSVTAIFDTDDGIYAGCTPDTVNFDNQTDPSSDAEFFSWDFNDGTSGTSAKLPADPDITHIFINTTKNDIPYTVRLIAESAYGCTHDTTLEITVYSNVFANFSIIDNEGCPPFETTVVNTSIGSLANSYEWHIDGVLDGAAPVNTDPYTNTYDNVSTLVTLDYQVKLIAENAWGCTSEKIDTVTVFEDVTAGFTMDLDNGCNPLGVDFTDASLVPPLTTYIWDFGDGASSGADSPTHTFYNPSRTADLNYTIEQIVLSANYCSDTITDQVSVYHLPFSKFWIDNTSSCPDLVANMNNFESIGYDSFEWRFGDGSTDITNTSLSHTYPNTLIDTVQNYTLEHWITTINGCSDSSSLILNVFPDVIADFTLIPQTGCNPITVSFDSDPSSDPAQFFYWDFGGDGTSNDIAPVHTFTNTWATDRVYDIMMVARSEYNCRDTIIKPVTAYVQPIAEFDINPIVQKFPNSQADIDNKTLPSGATFDYLWEFDDGETSILQEPGSHLYGHWGEYDVKLTVNSQTSACTDNITKTIEILAPDVNADFIVDKNEGCLQEGLDVLFTAASSSYSEVYDYYWEFGDGETANGQIVSHNFAKAGVYYVKLTASGIGGEDYEYETIRVYSNPIANFEVSPRSSMLNYDLVARVEFFNLSECNDTSGCNYLWDFGDGGTSTKRDDTHNYTDLGFYDIGLTVTTDHGCVDSLLKVSEVEVLGAGTITFPNAFTPNGDGLNDIFRPVSEGVIKYELLLYTRWGELIFTTKDLNAGWDGKINGELAKPDVYVWKAEGKFTNGRAFELAGDVTLVK
jgi:gliding motility-associated-like protein